MSPSVAWVALSGTDARRVALGTDERRVFVELYRKRCESAMISEGGARLSPGVACVAPGTDEKSVLATTLLYREWTSNL